jgi:hypothetical protein
MQLHFKAVRSALVDVEPEQLTSTMDVGQLVTATVAVVKQFPVLAVVVVVLQPDLVATAAVAAMVAVDLFMLAVHPAVAASATAE